MNYTTQSLRMTQKIMLVFAMLCTMTLYTSDEVSWLEIKPSYFLFSTSVMNEIYDNGGFQVQGSASIPLCKYLDIYGSIGYRQAWGHALGSEEKTSITVIPVDIGFKPVFNFADKFCYFFAVGPRLFSFVQNNNSLYVNSIINGAGIGVFVNTGLNVQLTESFLLGIFGEYSYENQIISSTIPDVYSGGDTQLGGFAWGVSLGYDF